MKSIIPFLSNIRIEHKYFCFIGTETFPIKQKRLHGKLSVPILILALSFSMMGSPVALQAEAVSYTKILQNQKTQATGANSEILSSSNTQTPDATSKSLSENNTQAPDSTAKSLSENSTQATDGNAPENSGDTNETAQNVAENEFSGGPSITATAAVLIDNHSGRILFAKEKDKELIPASITKIMTLLLIFEGLEQGRYQLTDEVTVSEHASQMGGSQVYLEPGEVQTVETMIKCISIASANDAAVAMAEFVAGSETAFIDQMNQKAAELGMEHTHFMNCNGLDDSIESGHYSSAYDVALMSRALITEHPSITNYSTVWMDTIIHKTKKGESEFGLTNTNKLIRTYQGITGLKTGSTSKAKYCLSATANRDGIDLTAVIMAAPNHKVRFTEAAALLDYGFANCTAFSETMDDIPLTTQNIAGGTQAKITPRVEKNFSYVMCGEERNQTPKREITYRPNLTAPIKEGEPIGNVTYTLNNQKIGSIPIVAAETVPTAKYIHILKQMLERICCKKS